MNPIEIDEDTFEESWVPTVVGLDEARTMPVEHVWTVVEGDEGNLYAVPGYHFVNRIMTVVTSKAWDHENYIAEWLTFNHDERWW